MIGSLYIKECRELLKSITYYIFLICIAIFCISQMDSVHTLTKPNKGDGGYGWKYSKDESVIMESAVDQLVIDLKFNAFATYPIGFYKQVTLSKKEVSEIYNILELVLKENKEEISIITNDYPDSMLDGRIKKLSIKQGISYEEFCEYFQRIDKILGGGSDYSKERLYVHAKVDKSYEDALHDYNSILEQDKISRAYARLFCDYMGIVLAILPVFLAVTRVLKDTRAKAQEVIYSKRCSSFSIMLTRYVAIVTMCFIPVILLSINPLLQSIYVAKNCGIQADYFAFLKLSMGWLLPTILFTVSMGFFFTELTNGPLAILVQGVIWLVNIFGCNLNLIGYVDKSLIPRFNKIGAYETYQSIFKELVINRLGYAIIALILLMGATLLYDLKRKGKWNLDQSIFNYRKSES